MKTGDPVTMNTPHGIGTGTIYTPAAKGGRHFVKAKVPTPYGCTIVNVFLDPADEGKTWAEGDGKDALETVQAHLAGKALSSR